MSVATATVLFFLLVIGVFLLPLVPAMRELRQRLDANALPVAADGRMAPSYFAERFRSVLRRRLWGPLDEVRSSGQPLRGTIDGGEDFVIVPADATALDVEPGERLVVGAGDLDLGSDRHFLREVYAAGDLFAGDDVVLRATLVDGDAHLGAGATVLRWMHAGGDITIGPHAQLQGRVSGAACLRVEAGTTFERLHAQRIEFGEPTRTTIETADVRRDLRTEELPAGTETAGNRTRVPGDLVLPRGTRWVGDLVVKGRLDCARGAEVVGAVKADDVRLEENVEIHGSVVSSRHVFAREGVRIGGLVLAEGHVHLARACRVGLVPGTASVRAASIDVSAGAVVHGSVWVDPDEGQVNA